MLTFHIFDLHCVTLFRGLKCVFVFFEKKTLFFYEIIDMKVAFLQANWSNLIMANYVVNPDLLIPYLPQGVEIDYFNGETYVSLVGFMFLKTKVLGLPIPFHRDFEEVNLRFYVKRRDAKGDWKRGVVFISEIVPKKMISIVANTLYGERYSCMPMQHEVEVEGEQQQLSYYWKTGDDWNYLEVIASNQSQKIIPNTKEEFIFEHYWGYTKRKKGTTEYEVQHPKWDIYPVRDYDINCEVKRTYGADFETVLNKKPDSVFLAKGSDVAVSFGKKI